MNHEAMARQREADDGRKEGNDDRWDQGVFQERLWKDYGKVGDRNSGIMAIRKIDQNV